MDITKSNKPLHLRCPKCGNDISINGNKQKQKYDKAKEQASIIKAKMMNEKKNHGKSRYYKQLVKEYEDAQVTLLREKAKWSALADEGERQILIMFKRRMYKEIGQDKVVKILEELEEELFYHDNEFMKQDHNNFSGA